MARKQGSHAGKTGPAIRAAALKLFAENGYAAVSMRQIAAEVGVQVGALYLYTPDKQTLLFDLMRSHLEQLLDAVSKVEVPEEAPERLDSFVRFHIGFHITRSDAVFLAYMELRNLTPENFAVIEELRRRYESVLEAILEDGRQSGVFAIEDVRVTTMALIALLTGVNTWFRDGGRLSRDRVEEVYVEMVNRMIRK